MITYYGKHTRPERIVRWLLIKSIWIAEKTLGINRAYPLSYKLLVLCGAVDTRRRQEAAIVNGKLIDVNKAA